MNKPLNWVQLAESNMTKNDKRREYLAETDVLLRARRVVICDVFDEDLRWLRETWYFSERDRMNIAETVAKERRSTASHSCSQRVNERRN